MTNIAKYLWKPSKNMCLGNVFSLFSYFFFVQKTGILAKTWLFLAFLATSFKNKNLIKKLETILRYMYLDGFDKFLVSFVKKYFLSLFKNFGAKESIFDDFSKMQFLAKIWLFKKILCEISFLNMYTFIYFTLLVFNLRQKLFLQNATKLRGWHHP